MKIFYHTTFKKSFEKLPKRLKEKVVKAVDSFAKNPFDQHLRNHALSGKMSDKRAFWVTGDVRVIFEEYDNYVLVIMLGVGTHSQIYN